MKNLKCDWCERLFDRPSIGCKYEAKHREPDFAQKVAHAIEMDISDRRGLKSEWCQIDDDIQEEIRDRWAEIIREQARKA